MECVCIFAAQTNTTHTMATAIKSIRVGKYRVSAFSMRECFKSKPEYYVQVFFTRSGFGLDDYEALVGYYPNTITTKAKAIKIAEAISKSEMEYRSFLDAQQTSIPNQLVTA